MSRSTPDDLLNVTIVATFDGIQGNEKRLTIRRVGGRDALRIVSLDDDNVEDLTGVGGTTIDGLATCLAQDATILKVILKKTFYRHDPRTVYACARRFLHAVARNHQTRCFALDKDDKDDATATTALPPTMVTLESLDLLQVTQGLEDIFNNNKNNNNTTKESSQLPPFILGLCDMKQDSDNLHAIEEWAALSLQPAKLGLHLYGSCPVDIGQAVLSGVAQNPHLVLLAMEGQEEEQVLQRIPHLARVLTTSTSLVSLGFPRGSLTPTVAQALVQALPGMNKNSGIAVPRKLSMAGTFWRDTTALGQFLSSCNNLTTVDMSRNEFNYKSWGHLCREGLLKMPALRTWVARLCKLHPGGSLSDLTGGLSALFRESKTLTTVQLDGTLLYMVDPSVWRALGKNNVLQRVSLQKCFSNPSAWVEVYATLKAHFSLTMRWRLLGSCVRLDIWLDRNNDQAVKEEKQQQDERFISLTQTQDANSSYGWLLRNIKETAEANQELILEEPVTTQPHLAVILPQVMACHNVRSLTASFVTKADALSLLCKVLPESNMDWVHIQLSWRDGTCDMALQTDFETLLKANQSLLFVNCPSLREGELPCMDFVPLRNRIKSVSPETTIAILPPMIESFPLPETSEKGYNERTTSIRGSTITAPINQRQNATYLSLNLFAKKLNHVVDALETAWFARKEQEARLLADAKAEEERIVKARRQKVFEAQRRAQEERETHQQAMQEEALERARQESNARKRAAAWQAARQESMILRQQHLHESVENELAGAEQRAKDLLTAKEDASEQRARAQREATQHDAVAKKEEVHNAEAQERQRVLEACKRTEKELEQREHQEAVETETARLQAWREKKLLQQSLSPAHRLPFWRFRRRKMFNSFS